MNDIRNCMYRIKPYYSANFDITTPKCMYKLKNFQESPTIRSGKTSSDSCCSLTTGQTREDMQNQSSTVVNSTSAMDNPELIQLLTRQQSILERLEVLKQEVQHISTAQSRAASKLCSPASGHRMIGEEDRNGIVKDIVICADPCRPPLSLFVLCEMLRKQSDVVCSMHVHSSVTDVKRYEAVLSNSMVQRNRVDHQFAITFIWKTVKHGPTMMVSPARQTAVYGESNIARYLARLCRNDYALQDPVTATEIDGWLDMASLQIIKGTSKERTSALRQLNAHLGKNPWLVGACLSVADIVMWSAVSQTSKIDGVSGNVSKWLMVCEDNPLFERAKKLRDL